MLDGVREDFHHPPRRAAEVGDTGIAKLDDGQQLLDCGTDCAPGREILEFVLIVLPISRVSHGDGGLPVWRRLIRWEFFC